MMSKINLPHSLRVSILGAVLLVIPFAAVRTLHAEEITFGSLLEEMVDMKVLARLDAVPFETIQYSSYDRRSTSPDAEGWFSNADGFGREPIPGFESVLRAPGEDKIGLYLVCDVNQPGAIVRGWSAGMGGTWRVYLDGSEEPLYEGSAYDFLARRSLKFFERKKMRVDAGDAFIQQDADYLPVPFAKSLRITWEGKIDELHFYHLQVRLYEPGTTVRTFNAESDLETYGSAIDDAILCLIHPSNHNDGQDFAQRVTIEPKGSWQWPDLPEGAAAVTMFEVRNLSADPETALRGTLLQIAFDGASKPQVEAPLGDFFGVGPGIHPYESLPFSVVADGTMSCRFVMPFGRKVQVSLHNTTVAPVDLDAIMVLSPWEWDDSSLYFRARWRVDHDMDVRKPLDLPYVVLHGEGRFVGVSAQIMNPSTIPTPSGSWWGEGDEKVFVDNDPKPVAFGTGSEDYFNYSWSRPDLFDHPFCGQPLESGPGNSGYVTNYRWQILDAIPFESAFAFYMELWHHYPPPGISYARCAYVYARPGVLDDHRRLLPGDLVVPPIPPRPLEPVGGARNSTFHPFDSVKLAFGGENRIAFGEIGPSSTRMVSWDATEGSTMKLTFPVGVDGEYVINVVAAHTPDGGAVRFVLNGESLIVRDLGGAELGKRGGETLTLKSRHVDRRLSTAFEKRTLTAGDQKLTIECVEPGAFGFDYLWIRKN